ncbi:NB-ARC [Dillenia turbinata]|uniref:NB-ARC n=1 Tax=Dillenia turbinata TaxID=194707 RepID=A0AAN8ZSR8_9MAGN
MNMVANVISNFTLPLSQSKVKTDNLDGCLINSGMMEAAINIVVSGALDKGKAAIEYVLGQANMARNMDSNYEKLTRVLEKLYAKRDDIQTEIQKDLKKTTSKECKHWIKRVKEVERKAVELESQYKKEKRNSSRLSFSPQRLKLAADMMGLQEEAQKLGSECKFERVAVQGSPDPLWVVYAAKLENTPSLQEIVQEILGYLRDESIRKIGLWGMVGTGKTTILQNINNNQELLKIFNIIMMVTVSRDWSVENVQQAIVQRLGLNVQGITSVQGIAQRISEELKEKNYLLLLDEVWEVFDLHSVGIYGNEGNSKIVLATRYHDVCHDMETDEEINVKPLPDHEAWNLFREKVGRNVDRPGIKPLAQLVAKACAGLPLLIDRVAKTFRKKNDTYLWRDGLENLKQWPGGRISEMDKILNFLRFCYDDLKSNDRKSCFLYGALYPEGYEIYIDHLVECWRAEGLIDFVSSFTMARSRGLTILEDLTDVSLFEKSQKVGYIKMNKIIRDMALKISEENEDTNFLVRASEELELPPSEEEWRLATRISLMNNRLQILPDSPNCNKLSTLFLQGNSGLITIPNLFFKSMGSLRVLNLHDTGIFSMPTSISFLTSLRGLYLNGCIQLMDLPLNIEALKHLEILDIRQVGISDFPVQIGKLVNLKCLRVSLHCSNMHCINREQDRRAQAICGVISRLTSLEELSIEADSFKWWPKAAKAVTLKVSNLTCLSSLRFWFPTVECLSAFISNSLSWKVCGFQFQFFVGNTRQTQYQILSTFKYRIDGYLSYSSGNGVNHAIKEVLRRTEAFELIGLKGVSRLSDFGMENMETVQACLIEGCNDMTTIISGYSISDNVLPHLSKLYLFNMLNLASIWEGPIGFGSLSKLTSLAFKNCPMLKRIFSEGMIQQLRFLHHLKVEDCSEIEVLMMKFECDMLDSDVLPRLKTLTLSDLPKLKTIWAGGYLEWPALENLEVCNCELLQMLPFTKNNAICLRSIQGEEAWWRALTWEEDGIRERLEHICIFKR